MTVSVLGVVCVKLAVKPHALNMNFFIPSAPSPPRNVTATSIMGSTVTLSWLPPLIPNGVVRLYMVSLIFTEVTVSQNTTNTNLTVEGIPPGRAFNVTVRAFTVAFGAASDAVTVRVRKCTWGAVCMNTLCRYFLYRQFYTVNIYATCMQLLYTELTPMPQSFSCSPSCSTLPNY